MVVGLVVVVAGAADVGADVAAVVGAVVVGADVAGVVADCEEQEESTMPTTTVIASKK